MEIKIFFDNNACSQSFCSGHGLSLFFEGILFDTGNNGRNILENMRRMKINLSKIKAIVISHEHDDHSGGLWDILKKTEGITVYCGSNFSSEFKKKISFLGGNLISLVQTSEIAPGIYIHAQQKASYKESFLFEQSLVIDKGEGLHLITGCAHFGIVKLLKKIQKEFAPKKIVSISGGLHLKDCSKETILFLINSLKQFNLHGIVPLHCTGNTASKMLKKAFPSHCQLLSAGESFSLDNFS